jgi:hypothetical protein
VPATVPPDFMLTNFRSFKPPIRPYIAGMGTKQLPKGENTAGLNPDGTLAIGTPEQMRVLQDYWKRSEAAYERGEEFNEPIPTVKPALAEVTSPPT